MNIKNIYKYSLIFLGTLLFCIIILVLSALIPKSNIKSNSEKSAEYLNENQVFYNIVDNQNISKIDNYADSILLNIAYNLDEKQPLKSAFLGNYYSEEWLNANEAYKLTITESKPANTQYTRYWHGMMVFVKPLLLLTDIRGIHIINAILMIILISYLGFQLIKKGQTILLASLIIGFISIGVFFVPLCLEYTSTFIIMLIACILAVSMEEKGEDKLLPIFLISGMITCFFDFLTTETITLTMPLILVLCLKYKNRSLNIKKVKGNEIIQESKAAFSFSLKALALWAGAYVLMWLSKWSLSSIILKINAFEAAFKQAEVRMVGEAADSVFKQYFGAIFRNIALLFPMNFGRTYGEVILIFLGVVLLIFCVWFLYRKKQVEEAGILKLLMLIGVIPYIRYLLLSNHSYLHYFFTYRAQLGTVTVIMFVILTRLDKKLMKKDFSFLRKS